MNMSSLHYGIHLQQTYCLLSDIWGGEVHKVMNIKDAFDLTTQAATNAN